MNLRVNYDKKENRKDEKRIKEKTSLTRERTDQRSHIERFIMQHAHFTINGTMHNFRQFAFF